MRDIAEELLPKIIARNTGTNLDPLLEIRQHPVLGVVYKLTATKDHRVVSAVSGNVKITEGHHIHVIDSADICQIFKLPLESVKREGDSVVITSILKAGTDIIAIMPKIHLEVGLNEQEGEQNECIS